MEEELTNVKLCSGTLRNSGRNKGLRPPMGPLPASPPHCHPYWPGQFSGSCFLRGALGIAALQQLDAQKSCQSGRNSMFIPGISVSLKNTQGWSMSYHAGVWCWVLGGKTMGGPCLHMTKPVSLLCSVWA